MPVGDDPEELPITPELLAPMIEQPEPSTNGDWYAVPLETLLDEGFTHIEVHFNFDETIVNDGRLVKDPNWRSSDDL